MKDVMRVALVVGVLVASWPMSRGHAETDEEERGDLTVEITGFQNSRGQVRAGLFSSKGGFPLGVDDVSTQLEAPIEEGEASVEFEAIPHGTYAVVVYHDANANGSLDKNWLGMPKEGAGVHRPVRSRFPPPTFNDCNFEFDEANQTVTIELNYL